MTSIPVGKLAAADQHLAASRGLFDDLVNRFPELVADAADRSSALIRVAATIDMLSLPPLQLALLAAIAVADRAAARPVHGVDSAIRTPGGETVATCLCGVAIYSFDGSEAAAGLDEHLANPDEVA